jgi:hypothetical protein
MALRQSYESSTEVPTGLQEHYSERDGRWVLTLDPPMEDVSGLKGALDSERRLRRESEKQVIDLKARFEGFDPEEVVRLRDRVKGLDDADVYDKQGIEALVARRTESMKVEHDRQTKAMEREITQLRDSVTTTDKRWRQDRIKTALLSAVTTAKVDEPAIIDAVQRGLSVFTDLDDRGEVVAKSGEDVLYGKDGVHPLTPNEWIASLKASGEASHLWRSSSGGGAPAHHGPGVNNIDYSKLPPAERMTLFREHQANQPR